MEGNRLCVGTVGRLVAAHVMVGLGWIIVILIIFTVGVGYCIIVRYIEVGRRTKCLEVRRGCRMWNKC